MNKIKLIIIGISLLLMLSGCFHIERVINVNKDGSGTIEETVLMTQQFIDQMKKMAAGFGGGKSEEKTDESEYHDVEALERDAYKMGENVEYVSSNQIKKDGKLGYHIIYSFTDVSKLTLEENPSDKIMSSSGMGEDKQDLVFKFKKGKTPELTIIFPQIEDEDDYEEVSDTASNVSEEDIEMMKAMYAGMKLSVKVKVDGKIVSTNATHKDKNEVTLTDMDFDVIMQNEEALQILGGSKDSNDDELKRSMENIKGFKADMNDKVVIKFK